MRRAGTGVNCLHSSNRGLVVGMSGRRRSRSLRQDELSSPGMPQPVDFAVMLDLHHGAGNEQVGARDASHSRIGRDARCGDRVQLTAVNERRVRSGIVRPVHVHVRVADTGAPVPESRVPSICASTERRFVIVAPTPCGEPEEFRSHLPQSLMRIILITIDAVVNLDSGMVFERRGSTGVGAPPGPVRWRSRLHHRRVLRAPRDTLAQPVARVRANIAGS